MGDNASLHARAGRAFLELAGFDPLQRAARLAQLAREDEELAQHVGALLTAEDAGRGSVLDSAILDREVRTPLLRALEAQAAAPPEMIGHYRIVGTLGRGGMGVVYLAEQDHPRRTVALKVVDTALASPEAARRFAFEADVLARLEHPGSARIHEAGAVEAGGRVFMLVAMERVHGEPVDLHVKRTNMAIAPRLALFALICDAVNHAHLKGVVHRDLKPTNVLVDEHGQPRILDFGVARVIGDTDTATMHTRRGAILGTLSYMAPEQVAGDPEDVDIRADVYSLGAMLYALLAGTPPLDVEGRPIPEAARLVAEGVPAKLGAVDRRLRGDVETIAAKALEKDPARRYQSAADLAADVRRHLAHEPVLARRPSAMYQLGRLARRHRGAVAAACLVGTIVVIGGTLAMHFEARRRAAQVRADADAENLAAVIDELADWARIGARAHRGITPLELLGAAAKVLDKQPLPHRPLAEAEAHDTLGKAYTLDLGLHKLAIQQFRRALECRLTLEQGRAQRRPETLNTMYMLASALKEDRQNAEALAIYEQILTELRAAPETRRTLIRLGQVLVNLSEVHVREARYDEAVATLQEAIRFARAVTDNELARIDLLSRLGKAQTWTKQFDEARAALHEALSWPDLFRNSVLQPSFSRGGTWHGSSAPQATWTTPKRGPVGHGTTCARPRWWARAMSDQPPLILLTSWKSKAAPKKRSPSFAIAWRCGVGIRWPGQETAHCFWTISSRCWSQTPSTRKRSKTCEGNARTP